MKQGSSERVAFQRRKRYQLPKAREPGAEGVYFDHFESFSEPHDEENSSRNFVYTGALWGHRRIETSVC
jgi:hypothetical protein